MDVFFNACHFWNEDFLSNTFQSAFATCTAAFRCLHVGFVCFQVMTADSRTDFNPWNLTVWKRRALKRSRKWKGPSFTNIWNGVVGMFKNKSERLLEWGLICKTRVHSLSVGHVCNFSQRKFTLVVLMSHKPRLHDEPQKSSRWHDYPLNLHPDPVENSTRLQEVVYVGLRFASMRFASNVNSGSAWTTGVFVLRIRSSQWCQRRHLVPSTVRHHVIPEFMTNRIFFLLLVKFLN